MKQPLPPETFELNSEYITLENLIKIIGWADTGGMAKMMIQDGAIQVNGLVETRRGKKIRSKDKVFFEGQLIEVI